MADSLPTYNEVTTPGINQAAELPEKVPYPEQESARYSQNPNAPQLEAPYLAQGHYPQVQQPYPSTQQPYPSTQQPYPSTQQPYPSTQQPYQQPYNPTQQPYQQPYNPTQEPYQQPYNPTQEPYQQPYNPTQEPYQQPYNPTQQYPGQYPQGYVPQPPAPQGYPPQPPQSTNVTVSTARQRRGVQFSGGSNSFVGIIVLGVISLLCCFPLGLCALILAVMAYREYVNDNNSQEAVRHSRIAMALGISGVVLAIVFIFVAPFAAIIAAVVTVSASASVR